MKINNKSFNDWLEKEKKIIWYEMAHTYIYPFCIQDILVVNDWLIGLMVQYLLEKRYEIYSRMMVEEDLTDAYGLVIEKYGKEKKRYKNKDIFTLLREAIESIKEQK